MKLPAPAEMRKALVAVATGLSEALALGFFDGTLEKVVLCVLAVLGAYGVYKVPNQDA